MRLPFTIDQFLRVFSLYNEAIYPIQFLIYTVAILALTLSIRRTQHSGRFISLILSLFWFWMGIVYHWLYFSSINKAAYLFGAVFVSQGFLFLLKGVWKNRIQYAFRKNVQSIIGITLITFSLILYPVLSYLNGHIYPETPTLGLPCPTTILTLGFLCIADNNARITLSIIPLIWVLIGSSAAFILGMEEDYMLLVAGLILFFLILKK